MLGRPDDVPRIGRRAPPQFSTEAGAALSTKPQGAARRRQLERGVRGGHDILPAEQGQELLVHRRAVCNRPGSTLSTRPTASRPADRVCRPTHDYNRPAALIFPSSPSIIVNMSRILLDGTDRAVRTRHSNQVPDGVRVDGRPPALGVVGTGDGVCHLAAAADESDSGDERCGNGRGKAVLHFIAPDEQAPRHIGGPRSPAARSTPGPIDEFTYVWRAKACHSPGDGGPRSVIGAGRNVAPAQVGTAVLRANALRDEPLPLLHSPVVS